MITVSEDCPHHSRNLLAIPNLRNNHRSNVLIAIVAGGTPEMARIIPRLSAGAKALALFFYDAY